MSLLGVLSLWLLSAPARADEVDEGFADLDHGQAQAARLHFEAALRQDEQDDRAYVGRSLACLELGDVDCVVQTTEQAQDRFDDTGTWVRLRLLARRTVPEERPQVIEAYREWLSLQPDDLDACIHLAELLSWAPEDQEAAASQQAECARIEARQHQAARAAPPHLDQARVSDTWGRESTSFGRHEIRATADGSWRSLSLRLSPAWTRFFDDQAQLDRISLGARLERESRSGLLLRASYALHLQEQTYATHQVEGLVRFSPSSLPLSLSVGGRQRSLADVPDGLDDLGVVHLVGASGLTVLGLRDRFQVREAHGTLWAQPHPAVDGYAQLTRGWVDDTNRTLSVSAAVALDLIRLLEWRDAHKLLLRYGLWTMDHLRPSPSYWSPQGFVVHLPALQWTWTPTPPLELVLEGGVPLEAGSAPGVHAGSSLGYRHSSGLGVWARALVSDSGAYRVVAGHLRVGVER